MKSLFASLAFAACAIPFAAHASQIVNIDGTSSTGTSISLAAGTYQVSIIGTSQGGLYDGWDYATANFGTSCAKAAPNAWVDSYIINANGTSTAYIAPGNPAASTALGALANYQSSVLNANGTTPTSGINSVLFTLSSAQIVNFTVSDYQFFDNWGGESLRITAANATPEPSTFGMMGLALLGAIGAIRKKLAK